MVLLREEGIFEGNLAQLMTAHVAVRGQLVLRAHKTHSDNKVVALRRLATERLFHSADHLRFDVSRSMMRSLTGVVFG